MATTLEEKLELPPEIAMDDQPGKAWKTPEAPGRPAELRISDKGVRADFPGVNRMDEDSERGKMMHFLCNHELMAAELMALVLLKFPDAPKQYRAGVYEAMREEQMHTLMYMRRMRDCGIEFGELPVNDYFWRLVANMETPMDFVTRLNLTFEQSNLDFSKQYAKLFREVGDGGTAAVLEKIYLDEINHVGHGVKWFRKWKAQGQSDWNAFKTYLQFPLAPAKAKGMAPFNAEGRKLAGLDEDFIRHLAVCEQSRGRTPVVHWFNPNAESYVAAAAGGGNYQPNKMELALEKDLQLVSLALSRKDDLVLVDELPAVSHLESLQLAGFDLPEFATQEDLRERKLGGLRPWAWSPDAVKYLAPLADQVSDSVDFQLQDSVPAEYFSKQMGVKLLTALGDRSAGVVIDRENVDELDQQLASLQTISPAGILLKSDYSNAGRGHRLLVDGKLAEADRRWLESQLKNHGAVVAEPYLNKVCDFSVQYERDAAGCVQLVGMTHVLNDKQGRFLGCRVLPKWASGLAPEVAKFLFSEAKIESLYREQLAEILASQLDGYVGPLGVDAMVYRDLDDRLQLRAVVELNCRVTMGRVALGLMKKSNQAGVYRILRKAALAEGELDKMIQAGATCLNDPRQAKAFIGIWQPVS